MALSCWSWRSPPKRISRGDDAERGAVVFAYGRFGEDQYGPGSIALDQFDAHIAELADGGHAVLPLPVLLEKLETGHRYPTARWC